MRINDYFKRCSFIYLLFFAFFLSLALSSCAPVKKPEQPPLLTIPKRSNARHIVAPGETLWRLSKMYDVPIANIVKANRLDGQAPLKMGQELTIPNANEIRPVISLFPSYKWQYIIIHHSATDEGSSLSFNKSHLAKGWDKGVGYHFVIDNPTNRKQDGQIEVTPRWLKQEDGAHCKASDMNVKAIGICLVGNFHRDRPSKEQMDSLVFLVDKLRRFYHIPLKNILRHGHVPTSATECPGNNFPWDSFIRRLKNN